MAQTALELGALAAAELTEPSFPFLSCRRAAAAGRAPGLQHVIRHRERLERDAEIFLGGLELVGAERLAVRLRGAGLVRRAEADGGAAGDQRRLVGFLRAGDRSGDGGLVMAVDLFGGPARGLEALHLVDGIGDRGRAVDRDAVVVVEHDQLAELPVPGHRDRFLRHAFHQVAVGGEHIGVVVDDLLAELGGQHLLGERHADRGRDALAERTGGGLDALGVEVLGMARGQAAELAELLELIQRHVGIAGQIQQRIEQHRAVAGREHEAVAVGPVGGSGVEFQELREQHRGDVGGAHRQAGMARFRLLDSVHREATDRIGHAVVIDLRHV